MVGGPDDACGDIDVAARTGGIEHLDGQDRCLRRDAGLGQAVALDLRHGAGDVRAVPVVVDRVVAAGDHVPAGQQTPGEVGSGGHARVDDGDDDAGAARDRPGRRDADGVEAPLLRAPRIGRREVERTQAAHGLGEADGARAPQRAQGGSPMGRRHVHDDHAQARDSADLDGVCGLERRRGDGARPQADGDGVAGARRARKEQEDQGDEGGHEAAGVRRRHAGSLAGGRVTAQARGVPDV